MSEQDPERWSALDRPETDELQQAADNPGMSYADPTETAMSDAPYDEALDGAGNVAQGAQEGAQEGATGDEGGPQQ